MKRPQRERIMRLQAVYFLATGLLPLVSMRLFERISGKKTDRWLVRTVGLLAASIGAALLCAARRDAKQTEILVLSVCSSMSFAGIDVVYVLRKTISPVYLADALVEMTIVTLLAVAE